MKDMFLERDAVISVGGRYRYLLRRVWNFDLPRAIVVMLNPSTADAETNDATIRSLCRLLGALGYGGYEVVNLFAWRATDPDELAKADDPIGPRNDRVIAAAVARCDILICAWGAHPMADARAREVQQNMRSMRPAVFCFGKTKKGAPKHPLYLKTGTMLEAMWQ